MQPATPNTLHKLALPAVSAGHFGLGGIFVISSLLVWLFFFWVVARGNISAQFVGFLLVAMLAWIVIFILTLLFLDRSIALLAYLLNAAVLVAIFGLNAFVLFGVVVLLPTMIWAHSKAEHEKKILIEFSSFRITKRALPIFLTGLALFLAVAYQVTVIGPALEKDDLQIPPELYNALFESVEMPLRILMPGYERGMSIEDLQQALLGTFLPGDISQQVSDNTLFSSSFLKEEYASQSLREFSYTWFNSNIKTVLEPYRGFLPFFFIVGLFFVFKTLSLPFLWISLLFSWVVVKLLLLYNVVHKQESETVKKEVIL